jgi:hypothetical protein
MLLMLAHDTVAFPLYSCIWTVEIDVDSYTRLYHIPMSCIPKPFRLVLLDMLDTSIHSLVLVYCHVHLLCSESAL